MLAKPFRPSIRLYAFARPATAKQLKAIANMGKVKSRSIPGRSSAGIWALSKKEAKPAEAAVKNKRVLTDTFLVISSVNPAPNAGRLQSAREVNAIALSPPSNRLLNVANAIPMEIDKPPILGTAIE
jgi:hypothetical protein